MQSFLTEQEVSTRLNVSVATLRRWRLEKRGPTFRKVGSLVGDCPEDSRRVGGRAPNRRRGKLIIEAGRSRRERSSMIYKRTGHWHLDVTIHGVRYREALN